MGGAGLNELRLTGADQAAIRAGLMDFVQTSRSASLGIRIIADGKSDVMRGARFPRWPAGVLGV
jgi:hypothetical protein